MITSVHHFGLTSFYPLNRLKFYAESNYDTAHARRRKEMVDIFCVMLFKIFEEHFDGDPVVS